MDFMVLKLNPRKDTAITQMNLEIMEHCTKYENVPNQLKHQFYQSPQLDNMKNTAILSEVTTRGNRHKNFLSL